MNKMIDELLDKITVKGTKWQKKIETFPHEYCVQLTNKNFIILCFNFISRKPNLYISSDMFHSHGELLIVTEEQQERVSKLFKDLEYFAIKTLLSDKKAPLPKANTPTKEPYCRSSKLYFFASAIFLISSIIFFLTYVLK